MFKEFYGEYPCTYYSDSTISVLVYFITSIHLSAPLPTYHTIFFLLCFKLNGRHQNPLP